MQIINTSTKEETFRRLHTQYDDRLLNSMTAMVQDRDTAEDITSTAFMKALENLANFHGESSLYTWLHTIAVNESRQLRHRNCAVPLDSINESALKRRRRHRGRRPWREKSAR